MNDESSNYVFNKHLISLFPNMYDISFSDYRGHRAKVST